MIETLETYPFAAIHWDGWSETLWMEWKGFACDEPFQTALDRGLSELSARKGRRWLADLRRLGVLSPEDQKWAGEDWYPRAVQAGLRSMAIVMPKRAIAKMAVSGGLRADPLQAFFAASPLTVQYFSEIEAARQWLKEKG